MCTLSWAFELPRVLLTSRRLEALTERLWNANDTSTSNIGKAQDSDVE